MRRTKPFVLAVCSLVFIAVFYVFAFPPLAAWIERRGIYSDSLARLEPDYQAVATRLPRLADYYHFCDVYTRTSEPPDVGCPCSQ